MNEWMNWNDCRKRPQTLKDFITPRHQLCCSAGECKDAKGKEKILPFLLQGSEVLLEGRADLAQQLHQRMAQEAGIGWLRVEGVGSGSVDA